LTVLPWPSCEKSLMFLATPFTGVIFCIRPDDGVCVSGPCLGKKLRQIEATVECGEAHGYGTPFTRTNAGISYVDVSTPSHHVLLCCAHFSRQRYTPWLQTT
jgi:hypothetical protein